MVGRERDCSFSFYFFSFQHGGEERDVGEEAEREVQQRNERMELRRLQEMRERRGRGWRD
jgi:hypothetical protein